MTREYNIKENVVNRRLKPTSNFKEEFLILTFNGYWSKVLEIRQDNPEWTHTQVYNHIESLIDQRFGLSYYSTFESYQKNFYKQIGKIRKIT